MSLQLESSATLRRAHRLRRAMSSLWRAAAACLALSAHSGSRGLAADMPVPAQRPGEVAGGISPGSSFESRYRAMSTTQRQSVIRSMKSVRVKWIRIDVPGNFPFDALVQDAIAAGMRVDALIVSSNGEATESAVGTLAARVVRHLKPMGVETYEVLNEVNGRIPALAYVSMLQAAYRAIKSVDPGATVLSSGLKPNTGANAPAAYLESMYAAGAKGFMDAVAIHPYSFPDMPMQPDGWNTFYNLPKVREVMVRHGDSAKKIWLTEFGCPTGTDGGYPAACTDDTLAQQIVQAYGQASRWAWIGHVFIYSWQDDVLGRDGDFGLYYADGSPKTASVAAYERAVRSLGMASTAP